MTLAAEKELEPIGESCGCADHDHDLIHDLASGSMRFGANNQYIATAEGKAELQSLWRDLKKQELGNIKRLKQIVADEVQQNFF